jgi:hypothetical protein
MVDLAISPLVAEAFLSGFVCGLRLFLFSAIVVMRCLRATMTLPRKEDISTIQRSMAALHRLCTNVRQLIRATFYLFGLVLFLGLQRAYFVIGLSKIPVETIILENFLLYFAFAANVFFVFLVLHLVQWFFSGRVYAYAIHSNT